MNVGKQQGKFVVSLDFELYWGVRDTLSLEQYGNNIRGEQTVIPRLLELFAKFDIRATFAVVGFLFFETKDELLAHVPGRLPHYEDRDFSPYEGHFNEVGASYREDILHYAPHLIEQIRAQPQHELATHTYSHYYCLEPGQTVADFEADLQMAIRVAGERGIQFRSLVFPRNQFNDDYLAVCRRHGITCVRSNEQSWIYAPRKRKEETLLRRGLRLLDAYLPLSGMHVWDPKDVSPNEPVHVPSSSFLRPYLPALRPFEAIRQRRICAAMTEAARSGRVFHLWWHPHNFGVHQDENFAFLEAILRHYKRLNQRYGFSSCTMLEMARQIQALHGK